MWASSGLLVFWFINYLLNKLERNRLAVARDRTETEQGRGLVSNASDDWTTTFEFDVQFFLYGSTREQTHPSTQVTWSCSAQWSWLTSSGTGPTLQSVDCFLIVGHGVASCSPGFCIIMSSWIKAVLIRDIILVCTARLCRGLCVCFEVSLSPKLLPRCVPASTTQIPWRMSRQVSQRLRKTS